MTATIVVPEVEAPRVSVLMVSYGACDWVRRSLQALVEHTPPVYEVIVVDNGSTDGTIDLLRDELRGATVHVAGENLGFGVGNDLAAAYARGEFLCLLNTDALVPPGWLPRLLAPFADPRVGAVAPMFVYPDGRVQEAGAVVEADGRVIALGRFGDPDSPDHHLAGPVPFASAACLLVRRSAFERAGGFDPRYGIAYYEDADLVFTLASLGLRLVVEPSVRVLHAQSASSPTSATAGQRIRTNQARFRERWPRALDGRPVVFAAPEPHHAVAARDFDLCDRVLVLCDRVPDPDDRADRAARAVIAVAARLADGRVTVAALDEPAWPASAATWLDRGVEVALLDDGERWLEHRRFHYAAVLRGPGGAGRFVEALREHQPQASMADLPDGASHDQLDEQILSLGLVPRFP